MTESEEEKKAQSDTSEIFMRQWSPSKGFDDKSIDEISKDNNLIQESDDFDSDETVYDLEPFALTGERISPALAPGIVRDMFESQENKNDDSEREVVDKRGESSDPTDEHATEVNPQRGAISIRSFQAANADEKKLSPKERNMLFEYKKRKLKISDYSKRDQFIGRILNQRYEIFDLIGSGNMAMVYKVRDLESGMVYAAKRCKRGISEQSKLRFEREIITHANLDHENIVRYVDSFEDEDEVKFLIMENIKGISLEDVLEIHGPMSKEENMWEILSAICDALQYAHSKGIIHRDLKSSNIILAKHKKEQMLVKILDFGIAKFDSLKFQKITTAGYSVGSPLYMSPEQCRGEEPCLLSDVYALGILAFELVVGKTPYEGESLVEIFSQHCNEEIHPRSLCNSDVNIACLEQYDRIVSKAVQYEPANRFESAAAFKDELHNWIQSVRENKNKSKR